MAEGERVNNEQIESGLQNIPPCIEVRGARVHNLKNIDVDVPLHKIVVAGTGGIVCRRIPAVSGIPVYLYQTAHDPGRTGGCR